MAEPFCFAYGLGYRLVAPLDPTKFDNYSTRTKEIGYRVLIASGACFTIALCAAMPTPLLSGAFLLGFSSRVFRAMGFALQKDGYTHVRGAAPEKCLTKEARVMNWNLCGIGAGLHFDHGGVIDWRSRLDGIVEKILQGDADVVVLQEVYDTALAEALIKRLETHYAHFYMHLGPNALGNSSGGMILTKSAVHRFSHISFQNNHWTLNRGFGVLEIKATPSDSNPFARIIGTHFIHGKKMELRKEQFVQILNKLSEERTSLPTVIAGDLNVERDDIEGAWLKDFLDHGYQGSEPTCTSRLSEQWDPSLGGKEETIDYLSLFKRVKYKGKWLPVDPSYKLRNCHLIRGFDGSYNTKTALSDHHGLTATLETQKSD
jgi:endonuclease/exonuclease/phosphatase family metal-dependent hydrolase